MKSRVLLACALAATGLVTSSSFGQIQTAGTLLVNVDATGSPSGAISYLTNNGALGGVFLANNNGVASVTPQIIALGGNGTRGVLLDGNCVSLRHYTDPSGSTMVLPPAGLVGVNPVFSVEVWMYKPTIMAETGPVAWGNRQNGMNMSCNWGRNITWGGFSFQGGSWDHGWNVVPSAGTWHHLVWTFDGSTIVNLYQDSVLDKTAYQTAVVNVESTNNIVLGVQHANAGWNGFVNGVLAKVRIHDGVLTPTQIANNYSLEAPSFFHGTGAQDLLAPPNHRWSFNMPATNNAVGLTVPDTGVTPAGAAVVKGTSGNASFDGDHLNLVGGASATSSYVDLPNFLLSSQSSSNGGPGQITFEMWVNPTAQNWSRLLDFGTNTGAGEITAPGGSSSGRGYFMIASQVGGDLEHSRVEVLSLNNVGSALTVGSRMVADVPRSANTFTHYVVTWDELSNQIKVYVNGVAAGAHTVAHKMNAVVDVNAWLGRSAWSGDNNLGGAFREFRIYNRVINDSEVRRNYLVGPADNFDSTALVWNGNANGNWDDSTANWVADATSVSFTNDANVVLNDLATGTTTLNLSGTVSPKSLIVANGLKNYTIGGAGKISGTGSLSKDGAGTLTFSGTQLHDFTGPTYLNGGKTVVSVLANAGSASALGSAGSDPTNLVVRGTLSYQGTPVTTDRGVLLAGPMSTIEVQNSLTLSGQVVGSGQGGFAKAGPGTLVFANTVSNMLSGGAGPGFNVAQGTVVFDGTASGGTQTNRVTGELWVGGTLATPGHMVLSNSTLLQDTWLGIGRGNGGIGNLSTLRLENSRVIIANNGLAMGYQPGYNTNYASQQLTLNGSSSILMPAGFNIGESAGSSASVILNGNSWLRGSTIRLGISTASTGSVVLANSAVMTNGNYTSIGTAAASTTAPGAYGSMIIRDNAGFYSASDFNISDLGAAAGGSAGQVDVMNNATLTAGTFYVGKGQSCFGVFNQSGGTVTIYSTGGNAALLGNTAGSDGKMFVTGGTFGFTNPVANLVVGNAGVGTLTLSNNAVVDIPNSLIIGNSAGGFGTVNLDGGTIVAKRVTMANGGASSTFFFNGGTLKAAPGAASDFLGGLTVAYVSGGGARIDTAGNDITIAQDLYDNGGGGVTKLGAGTLTLAGSPSYSGPTIVNGGRLATTTRATSTANISVGDGAELSVSVSDTPGATISPANLTLGSSTGAVVTVGLGNFGNPALAPINVSGGTLTANGTIYVNMDPTSTCTVGTVPLISYGSLLGSGTFALGTLPPGVFGYITNSTAGTPMFIGVVITSVKLPRWEGLAGGAWDIQGTTNWIDQSSSTPEYFYQASRALFNDEALGTTTVNLVTTVAPGVTVVSNSALSYTFNGVGRITGTGALIKQGTGTLTVSTTNNTYTGATVISEAGSLASTVANNLGTNSSLLISNTGTLQIGANNQRFGTLTLVDGSIASSGATVTAPSLNLGKGSVNAALAGGTLTTFGPNTDAVTVTGTNTYTGRTLLNGSTLVVPSLANGGLPSGVGASSANPTNLVFNGGGLSYVGAAATTDRGYTVANGGSLSVSGDLKLTGQVSPIAGTFTKTGPATLSHVRLGTNYVASGNYLVGQGTLMFDGGASTPANYLQTNRINGDLWVGFDQTNAGALVLSNTTLGIGAWLAIDRGNGTIGSSSKVTLYDSVLTSGNMSMGYANGIAGNSSFSLMTLLGNSSFTSANQCFIGEDGGGQGTVIVAGNSRFALTANWFALGNRGAGTLVLSNNARATFPGDYNLGDIENGNGTLYLYDNATNLGLTLYIAKGANSQGVVHQYGGYMGKVASGGGDWRIANNATAVGTYNLYGGVFETANNFQIGAYGIGTWNQSGGIASCGNYPVVGRFAGSTGNMTVSGGAFNQTGTGQLLIIAEEGTGTLTVTNAGIVTSANGISIGHAATGVGVVNLDGGAIVTTRLFQNTGGGSSTLNLNGGALVAGANNANFMVGLSNANVLARSAVIDTTNYNINIAQPLQADAVSTGGGLIKRGAGALTLSGANTYTGLTTVNEGTLLVNGSIAGSATVKAGAAIAGTGTVAGPVTVEPGGFISGGAGIGTLTLGASPVLNGYVFAEVNRNGGAPLADLINVSGPVAYSGTLVITNTGADLVAGDTFQLFQAAGYSGSFTLVSVTPRQVVTWSMANLAANGTISVQTVQPSLPSTPTNIVGTVVGNDLQISWPSEYTGWILQGQTNTITVGLSNNWATVAGSASTNWVTIPMNKNNGSSFFRLVHP